MSTADTAALDVLDAPYVEAPHASTERSPAPPRIRIDRATIDVIGMDETLARIAHLQRQPRPRAAQVVTVNAQFIELAWRTPAFADLLARAELSVADGVPLVWASRLLGSRLPERVNGTDLMVRLCQQAAQNGSSVFFLGGMPTAAETAARLLQQQFPGLHVAGTYCPIHGFLQGNRAEQREVARRITEARPDLLFVALGAPTQEYWIDTNAHLPARVMIGVGGSFELIAGMKKRAPRLLQRAGCEWLWRLAIEPRRLARRYAVGNSLFLFLVFRQLVHRQLTTCSRPTG